MTRTEKDMNAAKTQARYDSLNADRWLPKMLGGILMIIIGTSYEYQQVYDIHSIFFADGYNELSVAGHLGLNLLTLTVVLGLALAIHMWLASRSQATILRIQSLTGPMALLAIFALPFIIAQADGLGMGNSLEQNTAGGTTEAFYFGALLLRAPVVVILALVAAVGVLTFLHGNKLRISKQRNLVTLEDITTAEDIYEEALFLEDTRKARNDDERRALQVCAASAIELTIKMWADAYVDYANGAAMADNSFTADVDARLDRGLAGYPEEVRDLVSATISRSIDLNALPASAQELSKTDRDALIDHAIAQKHRFQANRTLKEIK